MAISDQVIGVLCNHQTQSIQFNYTGLAGINITVNQGTFTRVVAAIRSGNIAVKAVSRRNLGGADGMYSDFKGHNELLIRPFWNSRIWEATVVHESVHASLDLTYSRVSEADNEVAAFVASAMYLVMKGFPLSRYPDQAYYEQFVRGTGRRAIRWPFLSGPGVGRLRAAMIRDGYNEGIMGTAATPSMFVGNG